MRPRKATSSKSSYRARLSGLAGQVSWPATGSSYMAKLPGQSTGSTQSCLTNGSRSAGPRSGRGQERRCGGPARRSRVISIAEGSIRTYSVSRMSAGQPVGEPAPPTPPRLGPGPARHTPPRFTAGAGPGFAGEPEPPSKLKSHGGGHP